jgi:hypothetical protein
MTTEQQEIIVTFETEDTKRNREVGEFIERHKYEIDPEPLSYKIHIFNYKERSFLGIHFHQRTSEAGILDLHDDFPMDEPRGYWELGAIDEDNLPKMQELGKKLEKNYDIEVKVGLVKKPVV